MWRQRTHRPWSSRWSRGDWGYPGETMVVQGISWGDKGYDGDTYLRCRVEVWRQRTDRPRSSRWSRGNRRYLWVRITVSSQEHSSVRT